MDKLVPNGPEQVVYEGKIFEVVKKPFKAGDKEVMFEIARRSPGTRLIVVKDDKLLLVKEFRTELDDYDYRLPGGKVFNTLEMYREFLSKDEDIMPYAKKAAIAEGKEEVGISVNSLTHFKTAVAGATVKWDLFYFVVEEFEELDSQNLEVGEVIHPEWVSIKDIKKLIIDGKMKEDRTIGVLSKYLIVNGFW
ncbi:NUDIX domain-containing protein [Candidatus Woesearchaeota archaeon]|jgi:ADP-ribose pyrophosphatase|nr:NUDIX domain-containing protein [Candidatus Woesearchaeota archaeon]MBT3537201.1 NUDIX domain-containing protein [Candidatus Woesearchaeota archaeon]MBT4696653.1 NUDIX domain-containing protein [Candidatus Woesearchaeota archaeon]MBT4716493.1 NUDIX domain-containing protein [Candidatus Woesearchaeota archaeon]MBT7106489.1 NUDIX domain-containing protein [Candidatus Woesearchaeota archaeon]